MRLLARATPERLSAISDGVFAVLITVGRSETATVAVALIGA